MAEAANPMDRNSRGDASSSRPTRISSLVTERPGLLMFAAVILFIMGGFQAIWAIVEFSNAAWISSTTYGTFGGHLWLWAILDLVLAAFSFFAGYDILRGGTFGYLYGLIVAGFTAVRWFFYIPAAPVLAIVVIAIAILIIYGLVANTDYFRTHAAG